MRKPRHLQIVCLLTVVLVALTALAGCKGKDDAKDEGKKQEGFSEQQFHPGLEGAQSIPGKALAKAETVNCQSQLQQCRQSVKMDMDQGGKPPASLDQGATASISKCPVSGKPYSYDPATGKVWCTTEGHEKL